MSDYRKASAVNLVVGIGLILFSIGLITPLAPIANLNLGNSGINLEEQIFFLLVFVFVGGYEIGKYAEMRGELRKNNSAHVEIAT